MKIHTVKFMITSHLFNPEESIYMSHNSQKEQPERWKELWFTKNYVYDPNAFKSTEMSTLYEAKDVETGKIVILKEMTISISDYGGKNDMRNEEIRSEFELTQKSTSKQK
mgnify:CR=1 FL=1